MEFKHNKEIEKKVISVNEADANKKVAWVMFFTFCIYTIMYILDIVGIFIIPIKVFTFAYVTSSIILLAPIFLNKIFSPSAYLLKHIYIINTAIFLFIAIVTLSYHATVVYAFPIAVASIYYSRREMLFSIVLTCVVTVVGQIVGYQLDLLNDANFISFDKMVLYGIIPRACTLLALASLLYMLNKNSSALLSQQIKAAEKIKAHNQDMVMVFSTLLESHDEETGNHLLRTKAYVEFLAREMIKNNLYKDVLTNDFIENLIQAAPLHDIGKNGISKEILAAKRKLTSEEFEIIKTHTIKGSDIIKNVLSDYEEDDGLFKKIAYSVTRYHHEKWDGTGYPEALKNTEIPLEARIMAVADVFDAISSDRPYRSAMKMEDCFRILEEGRGSHFEPQLVDVFLKNKEKIIEIRNKINIKKHGNR